DRLLGPPDRRLVRELLANAARVQGARPRADHAALDHDDADALAGQLTGDRRSGHPGTDHQHVTCSRARHALPPILAAYLGVTTRPSSMGSRGRRRRESARAGTRSVGPGGLATACRALGSPTGSRAAAARSLFGR